MSIRKLQQAVYYDEALKTVVIKKFVIPMDKKHIKEGCYYRLIRLSDGKTHYIRWKHFFERTFKLDKRSLRHLGHDYEIV